MKATSRRNTNFLVALTLLCLVYTALLHFHVSITRVPQVDGILGVLLGLFSAVQPAANMLDWVLFGRHASVQASYRQASFAFYCMNILVLLAGWAVISTSLLRYSRLT